MVSTQQMSTWSMVGVVVQKVSSDLKTPDSELDSGRIDPKKELENTEPVWLFNPFHPPQNRRFWTPFPEKIWKSSKLTPRNRLTVWTKSDRI